MLCRSRPIGKQSGGIRGVSPEEEKEGHGKKDLQKRKVLSLKRKSEGWWMIRVVSRWYRWRKCHSYDWLNQNWRD